MLNRVAEPAPLTMDSEVLMPAKTRVVGKDSDGKDIVQVWGDDMNWAHGFIEMPNEHREYYRTRGRGNAYYAVMRDLSSKVDQFGKPEFKYWYVTMHIDGRTIQLPTEFMNAFEGQEVCQIYESERDPVLIHKGQMQITKEDGDDTR